MATQPADWRELAKEAYRDAREQLLTRWSFESSDAMVEFLKEELREALLDLKQATIEERVADAVNSMGEVRVCLSELERLTGDQDEDEDQD